MTIVARWNGTEIARTDDTVVVEGNHYFPSEKVVDGALIPSTHTSHCGWKGTAQYYSIEAGGEINENAAWCYPDPLPAAAEIRGRIAFWKGVEVTTE